MGVPVRPLSSVHLINDALHSQRLGGTAGWRTALLTPSPVLQATGSAALDLVITGPWQCGRMVTWQQCGHNCTNVVWEGRVRYTAYNV